jgi:hypothetical protein
VLILALGLVLLFVAWRFARPLVLAKTVSLPTAEGMVKISGGVYGDQYCAFTISPRTQTWHVFKASAAGLAVLAHIHYDSLTIRESE